MTRSVILLSNTCRSFADWLVSLRLAQRAKLKDELSTQMAEVNTLRSLPGSVSMSFTSSGDVPDPVKSAEKESPNFHGLVQRLVLKEKEVLRLQAEVARLSKSGSAEPRESVSRHRSWLLIIPPRLTHVFAYLQDEKAKRDRDRAKFDGLANEVQRAKAQVSMQIHSGRSRHDLTNLSSVLFHAERGSREAAQGRAERDQVSQARPRVCSLALPHPPRVDDRVVRGARA